MYTILCFLTALMFEGCREENPLPIDPAPAENVGKENVGKEEAAPPEATYVVSSAEELKALRLKAGDIVEWKDGVYDQVQLKITARGREDAPIVLRAQHGGKVLFTGQSSLSLAGSWLVASGFCWTELDTSWKKSPMICDRGSTHCSFVDCKIDGNKSKVSDTDVKWVSLYGEYNTIAHCSFDNKRNMGCLLVVWMEEGIVPHHSICHNYFTRPYTHYDDKGSARNSQESIRIGDSSHSMQDAYCLVEGNHFYKCDGERAEIISNKTCRNTYRGNLFEESVGTLTLRHGNHCTVDGNYFVANKKTDVGGVRIIGEGHTVENNVMLGTTGSGYQSAICLVRGEPNAELSGYWRVKNTVIRDNTLIDCRYGIMVNYSGRETQEDYPQNTLFRSNTLVSANNSSYTPVTVIDTPAEEMRWQLNTIYKGKCKGIILEMSDKAPEIQDYNPIIQSIKSLCGVRW